MRLLKSANEALKSGDAKGARELSREATEADASVYEAWVMDGKCAHACGDVEDAIASYEKALGIKPEHAAAYQGLNEVYEANGNVEKRLEVLRHLVKSHKESKFEKYVEFLRQGLRVRLGRMSGGMTWLRSVVNMESSRRRRVSTKTHGLRR
jgi:superkiller protein 3